MSKLKKEAQRLSIPKYTTMDQATLIKEVRRTRRLETKEQTTEVILGMAKSRSTIPEIKIEKDKKVA